jgi:AMP-polyphosphate phosphotransferase
MLEKVNLSEKKDKKTYKRRLPELQNRLYMLQKATWDAGMPVAIIFEGWDAAGKGSSIQILTSRLDPRGFKLYPIREARTYEKKHPWLWRFWLKIPARGEIAIFDRSWYGRVLVERVEGFVQESEWRRAYRDIVDFERTLADDGTLIFKFFLHISKEEQKKRFKKLLKDPLTAWHVEAEDWEHHAKYDDYVRAIEEMLERTETEWGPWTIVEATDQRHTRLKIIETITLRLEDRLQKMGALPVTPPVLDVAQTEEKPETIPAEADSTTIENNVPENTRKARKSRSKKSDTILPEDTTAKVETNPIPNSEEGN